MSLIKPCPFCGGRVDMSYSFDKAFIECTNTKCKIQPSTWLRVETDSVNKLVKIWNTRNYEEEEQYNEQRLYFKKNYGWEEL